MIEKQMFLINLGNMDIADVMLEKEDLPIMLTAHSLKACNF